MGNTNKIIKKQGFCYRTALDVLIALALVLSVATKLRFGRLPIGPSEVLMVLTGAFIILGAFKTLGYAALLRLIAPLILFWCFIYVSLGLGAAISAYKGIPSGAISIHSALGLFYAGFVCIFLYLHFNLNKYSDNRVILYLLWIAVPLFGIAYFVEFIAIKQI